MIIRVKMLDENLEEFTMMFGDSYKDWETQFQEFIWQYIQWWDTAEIMHCKIFKIISVEVSKDKWKAWGGLRWCSEANFQHQLNREGCQDKDPDNPNPRQYSKIKFYSDYKITNIVENMFRKRLKHFQKYMDDPKMLKERIETDIEERKLKKQNATL